MRAFFVLVLVALVGRALIMALNAHSLPPNSVAALLTETDPPAGFSYALAPREFDFPRDHGSHDDFRSEWWYFTGNLTDDHGRPFGFQFTLFRFAMRAKAAVSPSPWRTNDLYLGHFAIADIESEKFHSFERRARGALEQAGVRSAPTKFWIKDWRLEQVDATSERWGLHARAGALSLALEFTATKPIVRQGDRGLSQKSASAGNASFYYSIPRLDTHGTLKIDTREHAVTGTAWFDHEWSTSALAPNQIGWDWFSLQLDDGRDLMFYQLRQRDGRIDPASHGVIVHADGSSESLASSAVDLRVREYWRSPGGGRYPSAWEVRIKSHDLFFSVQPRFAGQLWQKNFRYWEGAVTVASSDGSTNGVGYVELVGYE